MKPLHLTMQAFGPYAGRQELDFTCLNGEGLFLLHGQTGAGKTTILDALCFALFGETSGGERDEKGMRSDFADAETSTEVTLDFSVGPERFRVRRYPQQERRKQRGEGTTLDSQTATLWRRTHLSSPGEEGEVLATKWTEVTRELERRVGFGKDQFRQIVVLPQGQFREILVADSARREQILATLFRTERYKLLQQRLKDEADAIRKHHEDMSRRRGELLTYAGVDSSEALGSRLEALALEAEALTGEIEVAKATLETATRGLEEGRGTASLVAERESAAADLSSLEQRAEEMRARRTEYDAAVRAHGLADVEREAAERRRDHESAAEALRTAHELAAATSERVRAASETLRIESDRETFRVEARSDLARLNELVPRVAALAEAQRELQQAEEEVRLRRASRDSAAEELSTLQAQQDSLASAMAELEPLASRFDARSADSERAKRVLAGLKDLGAARERRERQAAELRDARARVGDAESGRATADAALSDIRNSHLRGQAVVLARQLVGGEPCSVCGSCDHPSPATGVEEVPSETDVERAEKALSLEQAKCDAARKAETVAVGADAAAASAVEQLEGQLGADASRPVAEVEAESSAAEAALSEAEAARRRVSGYAEKASGIRDRINAARLSCETAGVALGEAEKKQHAASTRLEERLSGIPEPLREPSSLESAHEDALARSQALEMALQRARSAAVEADVAQAGATSAAGSAQVRVSDTAAAEVAATQRFQSRLASAGFEAASYAASRRGDAERETLRADLEAYDRGLALARERYRNADEAAGDREMPDLDTLEKVRDQASSAHDDANSRRGSHGELLKQVQKYASAFEEVTIQLKELDAEYRVAGEIARVANGDNTQRVAFQRYVLGALLDDVLRQANARLKVMTRNRYALQRAEGAQRGSRIGGLDLEVMDYHSGRARPAKSLSGGEGFLAALSLALGLADVVQGELGGIHLETIFVDEGFGTLDPESLDLALRALIDLQSTGRLVGIVSHVPELRQQIPRQLHVTGDRRGSVARFMLG